MNTSARGIKVEMFGRIDNEDVRLYTLTNAQGHYVQISNYGGIITHWVTKDASGRASSVVIGFPRLEDYIPNDPHFGAIIGRFANRIKRGKFSINSKAYQVTINNGKNHLHGGNKNFSRVVWDAVADEQANSLKLHYISPDGEEGFPGALSVTVVYTYTDNDELEIEYIATTDKPTVVNLTNHCYFNLRGEASDAMLDHVLQINADMYTVVDEEGIPTGAIVPVKDMPLDFTSPHAIGQDIDKCGNGYDHNYVLNHEAGSFVEAAIASDSVSGRTLTVYTDQPGIQLYTGNSLDGTSVMNGHKVARHSAFCLETQHYPDSPNQPSFPDTVLLPGAQFKSKTTYRLSVKSKN